MNDVAAYWAEHAERQRRSAPGPSRRVEGEPFIIDGAAVSGPVGTASYDAELKRRVVAGLPLEPIFSPGGLHGSHATQAAASAFTPVRPTSPAGGGQPGSGDATAGSAASWEDSIRRVCGSLREPPK